MKTISLNILWHQYQELNELVERKYYPNVSEAIRFAIKDLLEKEKKFMEKQQALSKQITYSK